MWFGLGIGMGMGMRMGMGRGVTRSIVGLCVLSLYLLFLVSKFISDGRSQRSDGQKHDRRLFFWTTYWSCDWWDINMDINHMQLFTQNKRWWCPWDWPVTNGVEHNLFKTDMSYIIQKATRRRDKKEKDILDMRDDNERNWSQGASSLKKMI